jgi:SAM-dependent methyltransferase
MNPDYYREYFHNEREHWWFRARESILRAQVERLIRNGTLPERPRILNIGAATGRTSEWLGELGEVISLEYDADCCRLTREATGLDITEGSILELPWEEASFDLCCAFDVIEHVEDDRRAVSEMLRVTRPGGCAFVTVPAGPGLWGEHDDINHHFRRYRMGELKALFEGASILQAGGFNTLLYPPIALHRGLRRMAGRFKPRGNQPLRSDFSRSRSTILGRLLEGVFRSERLWLDRGLLPPFGVSAMVVARKPQ